MSAPPSLLPADPAAPGVFVDSSVFFAAACSNRGSAHDLIVAGLRGRLALVVSEYVLTETERNLRASAPRALPAFARLCRAVPFRLSAPDTALVGDTARVVVAKDAPIVAAARAAKVTLLATYDRKDLLDHGGSIAAAFGITVATPDEILRTLGER